MDFKAEVSLAQAVVDRAERERQLDLVLRGHFDGVHTAIRDLDDVQLSCP